MNFQSPPNASYNASLICFEPDELRTAEFLSYQTSDAKTANTGHIVAFLPLMFYFHSTTNAFYFFLDLKLALHLPIESDPYVHFFSTSSITLRGNIKSEIMKYNSISLRSNFLSLH